MRQSRAMLILLIAGALAMACAVWWYYGRQREALLTSTARELASIARSKSMQVEAWRRERIAAGRLLRSAPIFNGAAKAVILEQPAADSLRPSLLAVLVALAREFGYVSCALVDLDGKTHLETGAHAGDEPAYAEFARWAVAGNDAILSDVYREPHSGLNVIYLAVPVQDAGALIVQIDAGQYLFPYVEAWPNSRSTGEAYLSRPDGDEILALTNLRHRPGAAMTFRGPPTRQFFKPVEGAPGVMEGPDYRGVNALRALRRIDGTPWSLVVKIDASEVFLPLRRLTWGISIILLLIALATSAGAAFLWRSEQLRAYRERQALAGHYDSLTRHANDIMFLCDEDGRILDVNERAEEAYGYTRAELETLNARDFRPPEALKDWEHHWIESAKTGGCRYEAVHRRKDGSTFPVEISSRIIDIDGRRYRQSIIRDISDRVRAEQQTKALSERLIHAQEEERARIARELHDNLSQQIGALSIAVSNLKREIPGDAAETRDQTARIQKKLIDLAESTRRLSHELHPAVLTHAGLAAALTEYCAEFGDRTGINVSLDTRGVFEDVPSPVALAVYRITQEALQNVAKHASVKEARVELTRLNGTVALRVSDRGVGFDASRTAPRAGLGLVSIRERTRLVNGTVEIASSGSEGTSLTVGIPV
jgi:PAS domain S-box-containing protein